MLVFCASQPYRQLAQSNLSSAAGVPPAHLHFPRLTPSNGGRNATDVDGPLQYNRLHTSFLLGNPCNRQAASCLGTCRCTSRLCWPGNGAYPCVGGGQPARRSGSQRGRSEHGGDEGER